VKKWLEPFVTAWVGIVTHKLRSFLTILGIVIGVGAVIALMAIGRGAGAQILASIATLGSDLITITPGASMSFGGVRSAAGSTLTLTMADAEAIAARVPYVGAVAPSYSAALQLVVGGENTNAQVMGITPEYIEVYNLKAASGSLITEYDYQQYAKYTVLGSEVAATLFPDSDPLGQRIRMGSNIVRVIGVLESKGGIIGSPDNAILIPLTTMQQMVAQPRTGQGERVVSSIALTVTATEQAEYVVGELTSLLRSRHELAADADDDFRIMSMEEIMSTVQETTGTITLLLGAIAAISLLVGGIGVMNIMLVSVLERTREIGILKALGATERDIWLQFLIEAAILTLTGGIIGIVLGWLVAYGVSATGLLTTLVTADIVILAVSVSVAIGLFFGFYPAWNASRLNPIDALRSE